MTSFTLAVLFTALSFFFVNTTAQSTAPCNAGDKTTSANINYLCSKVGDKTTFYPVSCQSNTKVDVVPGKTWSDSNFKWSCTAGSNNTMIWQVESCYTPKNVSIALEGFVYENNGAYYCQENGTAANGARIVTRTFTTKLQCAATGGKTYNLGDTYSDATYFYKCGLVNGIPTISVTGCKTPAGANLAIGAVGSNYECQKYANGTIELVPYTLKCQDGAGNHSINDVWIFGKFQYGCSLDSKNMPAISLKKCAENITYTDSKGKTQIQALLVSTNSVGAASNNITYWCSPGSNNTYSLIPLPDNKKNCTNGTPLNGKYNNGTGTYQCQWIGNTPTIRATGCVDDVTGKTYSINAVIDMGSYGIICACPTPTSAGLRNMTAAEWTNYKSNGNVVAASGSSGTGIEWYDAAGNLQCASGYEVSDKKCVDINECAQPTSPCDHNSEKCVNSEGSYNCYCVTGYARYLAANTCEEIACPCH